MSEWEFTYGSRGSTRYGCGLFTRGQNKEFYMLSTPQILQLSKSLGTFEQDGPSYWLISMTMPFTKEITSSPGSMADHTKGRSVKAGR